MNDHGTNFHIQPDQLEWLQEMTKSYDIADEHKALRIVLRYVMEEGDKDSVFTEIRCANC